MSVHLNDLPPKAREQVAKKMMQNTASGALRHRPIDVKAERKTAAYSAWPSKEEAKYHNVRTVRQVGDNAIHFDSQKEARRFDELVLLERAGEIRDLKLQVDFTLQEAYTAPATGNRVRAIRYKADFTYLERVRDDFGCAGDCAEIATGGEAALAMTNHGSEWRLVVEDVKSEATRTRVYEIKKKLLMEKFGLAIREV